MSSADRSKLKFPFGCYSIIRYKLSIGIWEIIAQQSRVLAANIPLNVGFYL